MKRELARRLAPLIALLDAKYFPLLFAVAPQSYAVYLWLWRGSDGSDAASTFAIMGAIGYEFIYVGAIAWAEHGESTRWTWVTAGVALIFSIAVAVYVYQDQSYWSILHAGFPLVAFCYTITMHVSGERAVRAAHDTREVARLRTDLAQRDEELAHLRATVAQQADDIAHLNPLAAQRDEEAAHARADLAQTAAQLAQLQPNLAQAEQRAAQAEQELAQARADLAHLQSAAAQNERTAAQRGDDLAQTRARLARAEQRAAQAEKAAAQAHEQVAQQQRDLDALLSKSEIDVLAVAQALNERGMSWREVGELVGIPHSTLRGRLAKVRTNGHLQEV